MELVGPSKDPSPGDDIEVEVRILNPQNVSVFAIEIEYPTVFDYKDFCALGRGQFDRNNLSLGREMHLEGGRTTKAVSFGYKLRYGASRFLFPKGRSSPLKFETEATIEIGNYRVRIVGDPYIQDGGSLVQDLEADNIPSLYVPVRSPTLQGTVSLVPSGSFRAAETSFVDVELKDRARAHSYEITIDPQR